MTQLQDPAARSESESLPEGWVETTLCELGNWSGGGTPSKSNSAFWTDGSIPWVSPKDMKVRNILTTEDLITPQAVESSSAKFIPARSILFVVRSGILRRVLPVGQLKVDGTVNQDMRALSPFDTQMADFLLYFAESANEAIRTSCMKDGTTVESIDVGRLEQFPIPLPPLPEQIRIADKLDALLSRVEAGRERLERVPKLIKAFRQSVLSAAVSGELTREWRGGEDAEWESCLVGMRFKSFSGGTPSRSQSDYWGGEVGWLSSGDIKGAEIHKSSENITKVGLANSSAKIATAGSVVAVVRSGILAHTFPVAVLMSDFAINQDIKCFDSGDKALNFWLSLNWRANQDKILAENREGTTVQSVKYDTLKNWELSLPPLPEQQEIVRRVEALFTIADRLEQRYAQALSAFNSLTPALLAKAFRGELVPQDPADEPATVLLERIRAARATAGEKPKRGRGAGAGKQTKPPKAEAEGTAAGAKRRGRPAKISSASSVEEAIARLEAKKEAAPEVVRAQGTRQVSLFED